MHRWCLVLAGAAVLPQVRADAAIEPAKPMSDIGLLHHLVVGMGVVGVIGLIGWAIVVCVRRYGVPGALAGSVKNMAPVRILDVRRATPRLYIATIQISQDRAVVVAENGQAVVVLAEIPLASTAANIGK